MMEFVDAEETRGIREQMRREPAQRPRVLERRHDLTDALNAVHLDCPV